MFLLVIFGCLFSLGWTVSVDLTLDDYEINKNTTYYWTITLDAPLNEGDYITLVFPNLVTLDPDGENSTLVSIQNGSYIEAEVNNDTYEIIIYPHNETLPNTTFYFEV